MPSPAARLARLRNAMSSHGLSAYIAVSADPHLSEYLPERWRVREWLTGFTGSAGSAVVTPDAAYLWADSRYWEQACAELEGSGFELMRAGDAQVSEPGEWLAATLTRHSAVGIDGHVLGLAAGRRLEQPLFAAQLTLQTGLDLFNEIWETRPGLPQDPVYVHDPAHAPRSRSEKMQAVRAAMKAQDASLHLISSLDDVAWLTSLRGSDVDFNPVFLAHLLIANDAARLFIVREKVDAQIAGALAQDGIEVCDYAQFQPALAAIPEDARLLIDPARVTRGAMAAVPEHVGIIEAINPSTLLKSQKTPAELAHVRNSMEQDGVALCEFFHWFDTRAQESAITELTIDEQLTARRRVRPGFVSLSFPTIAGFNANGAMPHYCATRQAHSKIEGNGLLLIDSGAQYVGGTTDITRVVPVGTPSHAQKHDFTLVLKGMINLSQAQFPVGLPAPMLDVLARAPIWAGGAEYGHGTGHGVGYFLNVHEGPQVISWRAGALPNTAMQEGMITSNEPGIYRAGRWGVRIENLVANVAAETTELGTFLRFETLTLCPIDTRCVLAELMSAAEIDWLNAYHQHVLARLAPELSPPVLHWLQHKCQPLERARTSATV